MNCFHCGEDCNGVEIALEEKKFCCTGCKTVYQLLSENNLDNYYQLNAQPGLRMTDTNQSSYFDFLELPEFQNKYIQFQNDDLVKITFYIPQIHCNSCIWLLESLPVLEPRILQSEVNFSSKQVHFSIQKQFSIRDLAILLNNLGYRPDFNQKKEEKPKLAKSLVIKIGVAGFCFGNIMLFAFPEYLGLEEDFDNFKDLFLWLSFFLSIPVTFYSGWDYLKNAYVGIKNKVLNMDFPIALGLLTLFIRSTFELYYYTGQAYFDSLAGLIFFLLIGKWFQDRTFFNLTFDRDYKSFFPIAVQKIKGDKSVIIKIEELEVGDILEIRSNELIPADAIILEGKAQLDYSFVTGESKIEEKGKAEKIFAGGKLKGAPIKIQLIRKTDSSYLTGLWNSNNYSSAVKESTLVKISNQISKYFTAFIILLSLATAVYWLVIDSALLWTSVTAVLIVACPCALALSVPFTYGNALRLLSKKGIFFRKLDVIDELTTITDIVLDKTGTLTYDNKIEVKCNQHITKEEIEAISSGTSNSLHPLSQAISKALIGVKHSDVEAFEEFAGKGISFVYKHQKYKIGSQHFTETLEVEKSKNAKVFVTKNGVSLCNFDVVQKYRENVEQVIASLSKKHTLHLLTGDNDAEKDFVETTLNIKHTRFNQSPRDKLNYIQELQEKGKKVLMIGDGINDSGALLASDVAFAVSNQSYAFTPASDAILDAVSFGKLPKFIAFAAYCKKVVVASFLISFLYNAIGLTIAVQGIFAPVLAAILMPLSSISVVLFTTVFIRAYQAKL